MQLSPAPPNPWREVLAFLSLCVVAWPVVATLLIGAYAVGWWIHLATAGHSGTP